MKNVQKKCPFLTISERSGISKIQEISNEFPKNIQQDFFQHKQ